MQPTVEQVRGAFSTVAAYRDAMVVAQFEYMPFVARATAGTAMPLRKVYTHAKKGLGGGRHVAYSYEAGTARPQFKVLNSTEEKEAYVKVMSARGTAIHWPADHAELLR